MKSNKYQQACKWRKTAIANKQASSGQKVSFKDIVFPGRMRTEFHASSRCLILCPPVSVDHSIHLFAVMVAICSDSPGDNYRERNYWDVSSRIRSPSYDRDWRRNDSRGNYEPQDWHPGGALLHSSDSVMDIGITTLLGGLLFRIGNMGWVVHIVNTPHPKVAIPQVRMTDRVEIIYLLLAGHTISLQITKVMGLKTMHPRVRSFLINLELLRQL